MSLEDILRFIFKRKYSIFGTFLFVVAVTTTLLYLIPPVFGARASVLIERNRSPNMRTEFQLGLEMTEVLNTEANLATSTIVLTDAVDTVKPYVRDKPLSSMGQVVENLRRSLGEMGLVTYLSPRERWIRRLSKIVEAKPVPNSNVLELEYFDESPERGAKLVNAIVESYLKVRSEIYRSSGEVELYQKQLSDVARRIADRRAQLDSLRAELNVESVDAKARLTDLRVQNLNRELATLRVDLEDLKGRFRPEHPRIIATEQRIATVETEISDAVSGRDQASELTARTDQFTMLIEADTVTFRNLKARLDEAELTENAYRLLNNVRWVDRAIPPNKPKFERLLLIILSIPLGLFLGFAIAFIREYFDDSIENIHEAEEELKLPGYGTVDRFGMLHSVVR